MKPAAFLLAGASAVQIGTATFRDPSAAVRIVETLGRVVRELGEESASALIGGL